MAWNRILHKEVSRLSFIAHCIKMGWGTLFLGRMRQIADGGQREIASAQALLLDGRIIWCHKAYLEVSKISSLSHL